MIFAMYSFSRKMFLNAVEIGLVTIGKCMKIEPACDEVHMNV